MSLALVVTAGLLATQVAGAIIIPRNITITGPPQLTSTSNNTTFTTVTRSSTVTSAADITRTSTITTGATVTLTSTATTGPPQITSTSTTTTSPPPVTSTSTSPPTGIETPEPVQPGIVDSCNRFHLVTAEDNCWVLNNMYGVSTAQLVAWNTMIGGEACDNMWTGYYVCIGVAGSSTQPPAAQPTPQPVQEGMVAGCRTFHLVEPGQNCDVISRLLGVSVADIIRWNPAAGPGCLNLWAGYYACMTRHKYLLRAKE
ncbi:hypothetical protein MCOR21_003752 [Pyricularia oryzae]|nr:hypothetical protein MCOR22_011130 [Pyricularia oryzae]KAI6431710.1 hypothetical protein MCOR21_003752 [Pyricularia oryzae]